ncbi:MAG: SDR family NAD(P)-dependent oxidoreductase [Planctomycetes bacterium]|nr:SDR family NAD(P)-dependent oxidoreductase [Planctomycetota bacterium]
MKDLRGRVALVTGAASGIGRATVEALDSRGCRMVLVDIDEAGLEAVGGRCKDLLRSEVVDVGDAAAMQALAARVHESVPALDILVNNAGIGMVGTLWETPLEAWDRVLSVNLRGVLHGCHVFVPAMVARGSGHVVNVSSTLGFFGAGGVNAYVTSKFAVFGMSESLRAELAPHGVGVSTICPGVIDTPIVDRGAVFRDGVQDDDLQTKLSKGFKKRAHPPSDVANAIVRAIRKDQSVVPVSKEARALYWTKRVWPRLAGWLGGRLEKQLGLELER